MADETGQPLELTPGEHALAEQLAAQRPSPGGGFRGALARYLAERDPGYGPRPPHLRVMVGAALISGLVLLVLGALISLGAV